MSTRNDDELHKEIQTLLRNEPALKGCEIKIKVDSGYVTLTGSVDRLYKKISAGSLVIRLDGVTDFENKIVIRPYINEKAVEYETSVSDFDEAENTLTTSGA